MIKYNWLKITTSITQQVRLEPSEEIIHILKGMNFPSHQKDWRLIKAWTPITEWPCNIEWKVQNA